MIKSKKLPDCRDCTKKVDLNPSNMLAAHLYQQYSNIIGNGMGGIDLNNILIILDLEDVPEILYKETIIKLTTLYIAHIEDTNGKKFTS